MGNDRIRDFVNNNGNHILISRIYRIIESGCDITISRFGRSLEVTLHYFDTRGHFQGMDLHDAVRKAFEFWEKNVEATHSVGG